MNPLDIYRESIDHNKELVTVFMLTYKRPKYLRYAIQSVLKQTYDKFLLVVIDNMSGDNTKEVVESFSDERVIYVEHKSKMIGGNIPYAFSISRSKYTIVMHDDDVYEKEYLERMLDIIEKNDDLVSISPTETIIDSEGKIVREGSNIGSLITFKNDEYLVERYIKHQPGMIFPAVLYRTSFFTNIADFINKDAGPATDQFLHFEVGRRGGTSAILEVPLVRYRVHEKQDSYIRGGDMDFILINYLSSIPHYKIILEQNKKELSFFIKKTLVLLIEFFLKVDDKSRIKEIYRKVPNVCAKSLKGRFYKFLFLAFTLFPKTFSRLYHLRKK